MARETLHSRLHVRNPFRALFTTEAVSTAWNVSGHPSKDRFSARSIYDRLNEITETNLVTTKLVVIGSKEQITWSLPDSPTKSMFKTIQGHDHRHTWILDFEGMGQTRTEIAATPTDIGIINLADPSKQYTGFI